MLGSLGSIASILMNVAPLASSILKGNNTSNITNVLSMVADFLGTKADAKVIEAKLREIDANKLIELKKLDVALLMQREQNDHEEIKLEYGIAHDQAEINKTDAASGSFWQGGWRPLVGWTCAASLVLIVLMHLVIIPILIFSGVDQGNIKFVTEIVLTQGVNLVMSLTIPLLGIGTMRTWEKVRGINK